MIGFRLPFITSLWNLTVFEQSFALFLIGFGMVLGSFLQSYSDNIGRKPFMLIDAIILFVFGLLSTISWNLNSFVIIRFCYGIGIGMCLPLTSTYSSEVTPSAKRGNLLGMLWNAWVVGQLLTCLLCYFFLNFNQWRLVLLFLSLPGLVALILYCFFGRESIHFLWQTKQRS